MIDAKKEARPIAGTIEQAAEESLDGQFLLHDFMPSVGGCQQRKAPVADLLRRGAENGIYMTDLAKLYGRGKRELRMEIARERQMGVPICADNQHGYFLPASNEELQHCIASMRSRAREITLAAEGMRNGVITWAIEKDGCPLTVNG